MKAASNFSFMRENSYVPTGAAEIISFRETVKLLTRWSKYREERILGRRGQAAGFVCSILTNNQLSNLRNVRNSKVAQEMFPGYYQETLAKVALG